MKDDIMFVVTTYTVRKFLIFVLLQRFVLLLKPEIMMYLKIYEL